MATVPWKGRRPKLEIEMGRKKSPNSRWIKGNTRYDEATERYINTKYREWHGWHKGALIRRVK
jgi:hypothetical protein